MTKKTILGLLAVFAVGAGVAACGSSTAPGVQLAPSGGATAATATTPVATPTTTTSTQTVSTPTSGPLATEPKLTIPSGPAPTHLVIVDLIKGNGTVATADSTVTVNYVGALYKNGKIFDSSWSRHQTYQTSLAPGDSIPGFSKGIIGMRVGGRRMIIIPPSLGYGATGSGSTIPPNATLVFVVDLLAVS